MIDSTTNLQFDLDQSKVFTWTTTTTDLADNDTKTFSNKSVYNLILSILVALLSGSWHSPFL